MKITPDLLRLFDVLDATWPAASMVEVGHWTLREGRGGGKRVAAATARTKDWRIDDLGAAEKAMRLMGQSPLFMIRPGDDVLDIALAEQGYRALAPVNLWSAPIARLTDRKLPRVSAFAIWEPLAIMREIWEQCGIGEGRQQVMERANVPKTGLFGRVNDRPAGVGFCAIFDRVAMVHALQVLPEHQGKALGGWMMRCAAIWAEQQGARWITAAAEADNDAATALYRSLNMGVAGQYHYRTLHEESQE